MQGVKGMEKLFFGRFFAGNELHIIHQQYINLAIFCAKFLSGMEAYRVNNLVGKAIRRGIEDIQAGSLATMSNGVQQMRLAQTHATVEKEWIVGVSRGLRHRLRRRVSHLV